MTLSLVGLIFLSTHRDDERARTKSTTWPNFFSSLTWPTRASTDRSGQQREQVVAGETARGTAVAQGGLEQRALLLLERQDAFLDGAQRDQAIDEHRAFLADAVGAIGGLRLDGGVPPGVDQEDVVGGGQVEAAA